MKNLSIILLFLFAIQYKIFAQKSCLDSLDYFNDSFNVQSEVFISELKRFVKGKDSAFIFCSSGLIDIVGITAYMSNGKLIANEVIFNKKTVEIKPLNENGRKLVMEFYSGRYYKNNVTNNRYFGDDAGLQTMYFFLHNSNCWYLDNTYLLEEKNNMQNWRNKINEFAWKYHEEIFEKMRDKMNKK